MLAEVMTQTNRCTPRQAAPVIRSFFVPLPPSVPHGTTFIGYHVEGPRYQSIGAKDLSLSVDAWLEHGTNATLSVEAEHYTPCLPECRAQLASGGCTCLPNCSGGSTIYRSTYDAVRQVWGAWKVD